MQYVVIRSGGKQYKVGAGDTIKIDKINQDDKKSITFEEVLLAVNDGKISVGNPLINGAKVVGTILENVKDEKVRVMKFKAKSRYRKTIGFRAQKSIIKIDKIDFGSDKKQEKLKEATKSKEKAVEN